jgi:C4-dicarboxylate transporter DctM subunit
VKSAASGARASALQRLYGLEDVLLATSLAAMALLPVLEILLRATLHTGISASTSLVQHLTLLSGMAGAAVAARSDRLLALSSARLLMSGTKRHVAKWLSSMVAAIVTLLLCVAATQFVLAERAAADQLAYGFPVWPVQACIPVGFALMALRICRHAAEHWRGRLLVTLGAAAAAIAFALVIPRAGITMWAALALVLAATIFGAPIFVTLGGAALVLFWHTGLPIAAIPLDHYHLVVNPSLPAIPLFTLAGYFLAEGKAPQRLLRVCNALFGSVPGGVVAVTVFVSAFFTAFTGASGVTILALGPLLVPLIQGSGYSQRSALGLVTSAGSLGVLFPPSLPLILYAIVAKVPMGDMFLGALLPGVLMAVLLVLWGARNTDRSTIRRRPFDMREAVAAILDAKWELLLPVVAFVALFGGIATPVEAAAVTAVYAFITQTIIHREFPAARDVLRVMVECGLLVGGVLLILGVALGFTNYLVDAQIPDRAADWAQQVIPSRWLFLLMLNLFLVLVGCLMEIFAAIVVVVPLLVPVGAAFGLDPVHLGVIFLANMELGFLTPLVGINVFFASYRFGKSIGEVCRAVASYFVVMAAGVLAITYLPGLSTALSGLRQ